MMLNTETWTDAERTAFWRGFDLAKPPGREEVDALERAEEVLPIESGQLRVAVPKELARAIAAETEALPENLFGAIWVDFLRGMVAKAGGAPVHIHDGGTA